MGERQHMFYKKSLGSVYSSRSLLKKLASLVEFYRRKHGITLGRKIYSVLALEHYKECYHFYIQTINSGRIKNSLNMKE